MEKLINKTKLLVAKYQKLQLINPYEGIKVAKIYNPMSKAKNIEAIKEIRKRENHHYEKANFCRDHNMKLDEIFHHQMEQELRRLGNQLEKILETGDVSVNIN